MCSVQPSVIDPGVINHEGACPESPSGRDLPRLIVHTCPEHQMMTNGELPAGKYLDIDISFFSHIHNEEQTGHNAQPNPDGETPR